MIDGFWVLKENNFEPTFLCSIKLSKYIRYEGRTKTFQMCEDSEILSIIVLSLKVAAAKLLQSCLTLCDPMDCSSPGFSIHGILQARTLERVAISFSNAWKWKVKVKSLSRVWLLATPWTAAYQAPASMGFSGQQYWSGVPLPSPHWKLLRSVLRQSKRGRWRAQEPGSPTQ